MNITNKSSRPIKVPLPGGKTLFLGPGKTGQINAKASEFEPLHQLVDAGDLEIDEASRDKGAAPAGGQGGLTGGQDAGPKSNMRKTGDR